MSAPLSPAVALVSLILVSCGGKPAFHGPQFEDVSRQVDVKLQSIPVRLENGLLAILLPDSASDVVRVDARYFVGADHDTIPGIAHFAEHSTYAIDAGDAGLSLGQRLERESISYNAFTDWEATHYFSTAPPDSLATLIQVEADRMRGCSGISDAELRSTRDVVRNEIRTRHSDLIDKVRAAIYSQRQRRSRRIGGSESDIAAIERQQLCAFLSAHYQPDRVLIVVSGQIDVEAAKTLLADSLGSLPSPRGARPVPVPPVVLEPVRRKLDVPIEKPTLMLVFPATPARAPNHVATRLNASAIRSFAFELEDDHTWITDVASGQIDSGSAPLDVFFIEVETEAQLARAEEELFKARARYIKRLRREEPKRIDTTVLVLDNALQARRRALIRSIDSVATRGHVFAERFQTEGHRHGVTPELRSLSALTKSVVVEAVDTTMSPQSVISLSLVPKTSSETVDQPSLGHLVRRVDLDDSAFNNDGSAADAPMRLKIRPPQVRERRLANGTRMIIGQVGEKELLELEVIYRHQEDSVAVARPAAALLRHNYDLEYTWEQAKDLWAALKMGGRISGRSSTTHAWFRLSGLTAYRDALVWRLSWLLEGGKYESEDVKRYNNSASKATSAWQEVWTELYGPAHSDRNRISRRAVDKSELDRFRANHLRAPMTVLLVGNANSATEKQIERLFGSLPAPKESTLRRADDLLPTRSKARIFVSDEDRRQLEITILVPAGIGPLSHRVIADMISQELAAIRRDLGASYGFDVRFESATDGGHYRIHGELAPERAEAAVTQLVKSLQSLGAITPERRAQFVRARRRIVHETIEAMSHSTGLTRLLSIVARNDLPLDYWPKRAERTAALTIAALAPELSKGIDISTAVIAIQGPKKTTDKVLERLGPRKVSSLDLSD